MELLPGGFDDPVPSSQQQELLQSQPGTEVYAVDTGRDRSTGSGTMD
jgi:hypothetical protein